MKAWHTNHEVGGKGKNIECGPAFDVCDEIMRVQSLK